ncbi:probable cytochrome P450 6a14 [Halyomorpha halys]|uniref:probable cytochrome P450 6a14 n=1 Tax=Halyomorpha halys TaxID=286706 RepID=UPI0006D4CCAF|nr:probable cytochrome P450 6a14 [Halyomorpha halys]
MSWQDWLIYTTIAAASLLALAYYKIKKMYRYFEDRNIPYVKPKFPLGSDPDGVLFKIHIGDSLDRIYKQLEGKPIGGYFQAVLPFLLIRDPEYVNQVLISSFDHFFDRNFIIDEETNPLDAHLFLLRGNRWRFLRNKLSPIFSSGKLRWMFDEMDKRGDIFVDCIDKLADGKDRDILDELARYATDVIESCVFGLESDSIQNPNSKMRQMGRELFDTSKFNLSQFSFILRFSVPRLLIWLKVPSIPSHAKNFFCSTMNNVLEHRRKTGFQRKDFVQLLLQLKDKEIVEINSNDVGNGKGNEEDNVTEKFEITDILLVAQTFVFFVAGFETTSRTLHFLIYQLAEHQEVQERARQEVLKVKAKHGRFSYDALKSMQFLDKCIAETLRMYPPVAMLNRECTKDFTFPDGTSIKKGEQIMIPIYSIHRDPKYFPDPLKYNPDRFEEDPQRGTYLPFGDGPRICIGKRFALVEIKIVMARLLERYRFELSSLNAEKVEIDPWSIIVSSKSGLWVKIHKLDDCK